MSCLDSHQKKLHAADKDEFLKHSEIEIETKRYSLGTIQKPVIITLNHETRVNNNTALRTSIPI